MAAGRASSPARSTPSWRGEASPRWQSTRQHSRCKVSRRRGQPPRHAMRGSPPHRLSTLRPEVTCSAGRKNAFGSRDASRRDEFTNFRRSAQFRERVRAERKAGRTRSTLAGAGSSIASPNRTAGGDGCGEASLAPGSPMNARAQGSLTESLAQSLADLTTTRSFAARSEFDRARDPRTPRTVYGLRERTGPRGSLETGPMSRTSQDFGGSLAGVVPSAPEARKVSVVREFYRANGGK